jgi:hypothetical protein
VSRQDGLDHDDFARRWQSSESTADAHAKKRGCIAAAPTFYLGCWSPSAGG